MERRERRIVILARDLVWLDESGGSLPFSYGAQKLFASLRGAPDLDDVEVTIIDLHTDEPQAYFEQIRAARPTLVAASAFVWSVGLFAEVASLVKRWDPAVRFVMGGPAARTVVLDLPPYAAHAQSVDAVAPGEGEEVIRLLARHHLDPDWATKVPGLMVRAPLGWRSTGPAMRLVLDDYPSPYQLGLVPPADAGYLETFRGCPINCAFCQWGDSRADRHHSAEYLAAHLRGFEGKVGKAVHVVDAGLNLNPRAFRNLVAAAAETGVLADRQVLAHVYPTLLRDEHVELLESFRQAELAVGIQSFDPAVLKNLGRPFDLARFERVLGELTARFDVNLELILGLPGDDADNFRRTFEKAIEVAETVRVFYCLALPDALLDRAEEFNIDFDPVSFEVLSCDGWTAESLAAEWEHVKEVAATMALPNIGPNWVDFYTRSDRVREDTPREIAESATSRIRRTVLDAERGFVFTRAHTDGVRVFLDLDGSFGRVVLTAQWAGGAQPSFAEFGEVAYAHRGDLPREAIEAFRSLLGDVHGEVGPLLESHVPRRGAAGPAHGG